MYFLSDGRNIIISLLLSFALMVAIDRYLLPSGDRDWPLPAGLALAGAFCLIIGLLARRRPKVLVLEKRTGRERWIRPIATLAWIPADYWGALYLGAGLWFYFLSRAEG